MEKQKVTHQETKTVIDHETGEITQTHDVKSYAVEKEPNYVKMYIEDIGKLKNIPPSSNDVLGVLVRNMSYGNIVVMIKPIKDKIKEETNLSINTINKSIQNLYKAGILIRQSRSVYLVDPTLFAKGKWEDIKKLRLVIDYNNDGTKSINSNMVEQLKLKM
mgnify:CR=1 FL=1